MNDEQLKQTILSKVSKLVIDFAIYDRKSNEDLSIKDLEYAIDSSIISINEICEYFKSELIKALK